MSGEVIGPAALLLIVAILNFALAMMNARNARRNLRSHDARIRLATKRAALFARSEAAKRFAAYGAHDQRGMGMWEMASQIDPDDLDVFSLGEGIDK